MEIDKSKIVSLKTRLQDRKPTFNRVKALLCSVINHGIRELEIRCNNNTTKVPDFSVAPRQRILNQEELAKYWLALVEDSKTNDFETLKFTTLFYMMYISGSRSGNLKSTKWDYVNFNAMSIAFPAEIVKNREQLSIPIDQTSVFLLNRLLNHPQKPISDYVFPNSKKPEAPVKDFRKAWWKFLERADLPNNITPHDIRRTTGAYIIVAGNSLKVASQALGHKDSRVTDAIYTPILQSSQRKAQQDLSKVAQKVSQQKLRKEGDFTAPTHKFSREEKLELIREGLGKIKDDTLDLMFKIIVNREYTHLKEDVYGTLNKPVDFGS